MDLKSASQKEKLQFLLDNYHTSYGYWEKARPECLLEQGGAKIFSDELCDIEQDMELRKLSIILDLVASKVEVIGAMIDDLKPVSAEVFNDMELKSKINSLQAEINAIKNAPKSAPEEKTIYVPVDNGKYMKAIALLAVASMILSLWKFFA